MIHTWEGLAAVVSVAAAGVAVWQARTASKALQQAALLKLFDGFQAANATTLQHPELMLSVHGLDESTSLQEARSIAYLSLLLDSFQHYYGLKYDGDFSQMTTEMSRASTFLNKILAVPENRKRWPVLKRLYYGDFDKEFMAAIDDIIVMEYAPKTASK